MPEAIHIGLPAMLALDPETARALGPTPLDWRVRAAACLLAFLLGGVSGVWPAVSALRGLHAQGVSG